jgi:phosphatidylserine decarboxylase
MLGSTVVMLFGKGRLAFNPEWSAARPIRMGEGMGMKMGVKMGQKTDAKPA